MIRAALAGLLLVSLSACGGKEESGSDEMMEAIDNLPACSDIWKAGEVLPTDYDGCLDGDTVVAVVESSLGIGYNDRFIAKRGQKIEEVG